MFFWRVYEFSFDFGCISEKRDEISKFRQFFRVLRRNVGIPRSSVSPRQGVACPLHGAAKREVGQASGMPRRSKATPKRSSATPWLSTVHRHVFLSCFSIPLFRGLVYWTNEDPISV